jgi:DNA repair exonuclease SbcCD ATPase subunit
LISPFFILLDWRRKLEDIQETKNTQTPDNSLLHSRIATLENQIAGLKSTIDELQASNTNLQGKLQEAKSQIPDKDAKIITPLDMALFERLKEFGDPKELDAKLSNYDTIKTRLEEIETANKKLNRKATIHDIANRLGYSESVLSLLSEGLDFAIEGEDIKVKSGDEVVELEQFVEKNWEEFLPVLKKDATQKQIKKQVEGKTTPVGNPVLDSWKKMQEAHANNYVNQLQGI